MRGSHALQTCLHGALALLYPTLPTTEEGKRTESLMQSNFLVKTLFSAGSEMQNMTGYARKG